MNNPPRTAPIAYQSSRDIYRTNIECRISYPKVASKALVNKSNLARVPSLRHAETRQGC